MAQAYLFVHFREKTTPDGEQVYFGISRDGFHWEAVNDGAPGAGQGYVPFVADSLASGKFVCSDASFSSDEPILLFKTLKTKWGEMRLRILRSFRLRIST